MIVEDLYAGDTFKTSPPLYPGVIRISMIEFCTRRAAYQMLGYEPEIGERAEIQKAAMNDGNLHELEIVRRLLLKGFKIWNYGNDQTWVALKKHGLLFRGHPDLFMEIGPKVYGLDVKAFRTEFFQHYTEGAEETKPGIFRIKDPMIFGRGAFPVMGQMQLYLHSEKAKEMGIEEWVILMKDKNTAQLAECIVPKMPEYAEAVTKRWVGFWGLVSVGRLPVRNFARNSTQCQYCPYHKQCWDNLKKLPRKSVEVTDRKSVVAAQIWRKGKEGEREAKGDLEAAKLYFEELALKLEVDEIVADGLEVKISSRSRTGISTDETEKLLDQLLESGVITKEQHDSCWSTTEYVESRSREA